MTETKFIGSPLLHELVIETAQAPSSLLFFGGRPRHRVTTLVLPAKGRLAWRAKFKVNTREHFGNNKRLYSFCATYTPLPLYFLMSFTFC